MTQTKKIFFSFVFLAITNAFFFAEEFTFKYNAGDSYRILSLVHEDVYFNGEFSHHAEIVNRISVNVTDVDENGNGTHEATFMTSESSSNETGKAVFSWGEEYESVFTRTPQGVYTISDEYFMPVVRNVPTFPQKDLKPGDTWTANGEEAHDLRRGFNLETPFKVPFTVKYKYIGKENVEGKELHKITAQYTMNFTNKQRPVDNRIDYPYTTMGYSNQTIYWDAINGCINSYSEEFRILIETAYGTTAVFEGTASAEISDFVTTKVKTTTNEIENQLKDLGVENTQVTKTDKGLTISIENIQFLPDSAVLRDSEKEKLKKIAQILSTYKENDLLITGHTALAGSAQARQKLSEERASSVASYLIELGVKDAYHIFSRGFGANQPIADNTTEEGKARNRRVEITILD